MSLVTGIDPGTTRSAMVCYEPLSGLVSRKVYMPNDELIQVMPAKFPGSNSENILAIEMITSHGSPVGNETHETTLWTGRFIQRWIDNGNDDWKQIYRGEVIVNLCGARSFKDPTTGKRKGFSDSHVRASLLDRFGGEARAVGGVKCKKCKGKGWFGAGRLTCSTCGGQKLESPPGPLHGISNHMWSAVAVAVTWSDLYSTNTEQSRCESLKSDLNVQSQSQATTTPR